MTRNPSVFFLLEYLGFFFQGFFFDFEILVFFSCLNTLGFFPRFFSDFKGFFVATPFLR